MTITHHNVEQGTPEWHALRCGIVTASAMNAIMTPSLKLADNDKTRAHVWEIAAQRINKYTEPTYMNHHMMRGHVDEVISRDLYSEHFEPVQEVGFITREIDGVKVGYSPDGACILSNGGIECKSRIQRLQTEVIVSNEIPKEHILQVQFGLLVSGWDFIDYISYCGGMPMWVIRSTPDERYQTAIRDAILSFEEKVLDVIASYRMRLAGANKLLNTERVEYDVEQAIT
jgi:predicted phage-related endonuclease